MQYLRATKNLPLVLKANHIHVVKWWADSAFDMHEDTRIHSGGTMSLGGGSAYAGSTHQKLNTKSSAESELVGANDFMT